MRISSCTKFANIFFLFILFMILSIYLKFRRMVCFCFSHYLPSILFSPNSFIVYIYTTLMRANKLEMSFCRCIQSFTTLFVYFFILIISTITFLNKSIYIFSFIVFLQCISKTAGRIFEKSHTHM